MTESIKNSCGDSPSCREPSRLPYFAPILQSFGSLAHSTLQGPGTMAEVTTYNPGNFLQYINCADMMGTWTPNTGFAFPAAGPNNMAYACR